METTGAIPQQRANHSSAIIEETGELLVFGGWCVSETGCVIDYFDFLLCLSSTKGMAQNA